MKILMISPVFPFPTNTGGKVRINKIFQGLARYHKVTFISPAPTAEVSEEDWEVPDNSKLITVRCSTTNLGSVIKSLFSRNPYHYFLWHRKELHDKIAEVLNLGEFDLVYCHFIYSIPRVVDTNLPIVVDTHNVDSEYWQRKVDYYKTQKKFLKYLYSFINVLKVIEFERRILPSVFGIVAVSNSDREYYAKQFSSHLYLAPNGVDINHYKPTKKTTDNDITLGFLGSLNMELNQDASFLLCGEILPKVQLQVPNQKITALIIGRDPPKSLQDFAKKGPVKNITVLGTVPDVNPYLQKVDILVLPLRHGAGSKIRTFEAMATGICIVGSPLAYIGIDGFIPNTHAIIANSIDEFVEKICYLIEHVETRIELAQASLKFVHDKFDWNRITERLSQDLNEVFGR